MAHCGIFLRKCGCLQGREGSVAARNAAEAELALSERALRKNPKSYASWHHRRWVIEKGLTPLERELQLLAQCVLEQVCMHSHCGHAVGRSCESTLCMHVCWTSIARGCREMP